MVLRIEGLPNKVCPTSRFPNAQKTLILLITLRRSYEHFQETGALLLTMALLVLTATN